MTAVRLQKLLSGAGVASRRASEELITAGRVTVNGAMVRDLGSRADDAVDDVRVDGVRLKPPSRRYILLNKPTGFVTTRSDPQRRPTILNLLRDVTDYLYPVGRLDYDSEGLLIVTNDGELTAALTHPRHGVIKVYEVIVGGEPRLQALERLRRGVVIDGRRTVLASVRVLRSASHRGRLETLLEIGIREGRQRQIRRMCDAVGYRVLKLRRVRIGPVSDARLKPGMWRELTSRELRALSEAAGLVAGGEEAVRPPGVRPTAPAPRTKRSEGSRHSRGPAPGRVRRG